MRNLELAWQLEQIAELLEIRDENPFKVRAYRRAAAVIRELPEPVDTVAARGELRRLPGVGEALAAKIEEWLRTGRIAFYDQLARELPPALADLLRILGVGPKAAYRLYRELGVTTVAELEQACREGRVRNLKGFGARSEERILEGIQRLQTHQTRTPLGEALALAREITAWLRALPAVQRVEVAGSARRMRETVGDLDLVCASADPGPVMEAFAALPFVTRVLALGDTRASVVLRTGLQVDLRVVPPAAFATALHHFTGSQAHNVHLRRRAREKGLHISEYGVARDDGTPLPVENEAALYELLDLPYIPPELREDRGEIEAALAGRLPRLVEVEQVRGDLHVHSTWSDGASSLEEMVAAAAARGYEFIGVSDHSPSLAVAGGLSPDRLRQKWAEIERVQARYPGIHILRSAEVDILPDGRLDYPDDLLAAMDLVIASIHSRLNQETEQITARLLAAIRHPAVHVIAHPTGRLLGRRAPYPFDFEAVCREAAAHGVALEINASPDRLDLNDEHLVRARRLGVFFVADTDAHHTRQLADLRLGIGQARRAWLGPEAILNTLPWGELRKRLRAPPAPA